MLFNSIRKNNVSFYEIYERELNDGSLFLRSATDLHVKDCVRTYTQDWSVVNRK